MINYPIKFMPILQPKIWGGNKLGDFLNKNIKADDIGESWEISGIKGNISKVMNGPENGKELTTLIQIYRENS